ncbi:uncharacterized protein TNCV_2262431 [Trichonephila clavipes]|nr:uncharacterized protein TNCV_2262431 [Trichonephila clavipes]
MKLQKTRSGDQYSEHVRQYKRHASNSTYSLQVPVSQFVKYGWKKSPGRLHTLKNDRKAAGGPYRNSVPAEFGINKSVVLRAWKAFQTTGTAVRKVGGGRRGRQLQGMTDISSCRRKEADGSQQGSLLSNSLQQRGDKCRGLLGPDAFTKGAYSPAVLNAASR